MDTQFEKGHHFSSHHRNELEKDQLCGCFYCLKIYSHSEIEEWCDSEKTAICPYCGINSVIGESSRFPITELFLKGMQKVWF